MRAIAVEPGKIGAQLIDYPEPVIQLPDQIKLRVLAVGICGTDREEVNGGRAEAPKDEQKLVIGHEMFGQVVEIGSGVTRFMPGDHAVFTVRRGCGKCASCLMDRSDMCETGDYTERGIKGLPGYQTEYVVDHEKYAIWVPDALKDIGVLCEPFSISEKAIGEAIQIQKTRSPVASSHPNWIHQRKCLVAGLGPVGLLAAVALRLRGADVYGLDIVDENTNRPQWLKAIGGRYINGLKISADHVDDQVAQMDLIFEASGVAPLEFNLLDALGPNGIYVLTGIPGGDRSLEIPGAELVRQLVLDNQVMFGSVNAATDHFQMAVDDMLAASLRWKGAMEKLITNRFSPRQIRQAFFEHSPDEIKSIIDWEKQE